MTWLAAECARLGVAVERGTSAWSPREGEVVVAVHRRRRRRRPYEIVDGATVVSMCAAVRAGYGDAPAGRGRSSCSTRSAARSRVALAEELGERAVLVTQDNIAGNELSRTGDLAPANVRLQQRGVVIERRTIVRTVRPAAVDGSSEEVLRPRSRSRWRSRSRTASAASGG